MACAKVCPAVGIGLLIGSLANLGTQWVAAVAHLCGERCMRPVVLVWSGLRLAGLGELLGGLVSQASCIRDSLFASGRRADGLPTQDDCWPELFAMGTSLLGNGLGSRGGRRIESGLRIDLGSRLCPGSLRCRCSVYCLCSVYCTVQGLSVCVIGNAAGAPLRLLPLGR